MVTCDCDRRPASELRLVVRTESSSVKRPAMPCGTMWMLRSAPWAARGSCPCWRVGEVRAQSWSAVRGLVVRTAVHGAVPSSVAVGADTARGTAHGARRGLGAPGLGGVRGARGRPEAERKAQPRPQPCAETGRRERSAVSSRLSPSHAGGQSFSGASRTENF
eukprot:3903316-Prymnesium_polylepis.3